MSFGWWVRVQAGSLETKPEERTVTAPPVPGNKPRRRAEVRGKCENEQLRPSPRLPCGLAASQMGTKTRRARHCIATVAPNQPWGAAQTRTWQRGFRSPDCELEGSQPRPSTPPIVLKYCPLLAKKYRICHRDALLLLRNCNCCHCHCHLLFLHACT